MIAAAIVGACCGLAAVALVWLGERGCDAVEGRPSCGGVGLIMLSAIIAVVFLLGLYLLRIFDLAQAGLVAFFGVALPLILILLFLMDLVFSAWMVVVLPVLAALCFAGGAVFTRALENSTAETYADGATDDEVADSSVDAEDIDLPRYAPATTDTPDDDRQR